MRVVAVAALLILLAATPTACSAPYSFTAQFDLNVIINFTATLQLSELKVALAPHIPVSPSAVDISVVGLCSDTCGGHAGSCRDGGPGSEASSCMYGTDCSDCGPRSVSGAPPAAPPGYFCSDNCVHANNNNCNDGGLNSIGDACDYGTDCADCGLRPFIPPPLPPGTNVPEPLEYPETSGATELTPGFHLRVAISIDTDPTDGSPLISVADAQSVKSNLLVWHSRWQGALQCERFCPNGGCDPNTVCPPYAAVLASMPVLMGEGFYIGGDFLLTSMAELSFNDDGAAWQVGAGGSSQAWVFVAVGVPLGAVVFLGLRWLCSRRREASELLGVQATSYPAATPAAGGVNKV
jgi:hypothetical protein